MKMVCCYNWKALEHCMNDLNVLNNLLGLTILFMQCFVRTSDLVEPIMSELCKAKDEYGVTQENENNSELWNAREHFFDSQ